jgi:hypothetical protein
MQQVWIVDEIVVPAFDLAYQNECDKRGTVEGIFFVLTQRFKQLFAHSTPAWMLPEGSVPMRVSLQRIGSKCNRRGVLRLT